MSSHSSFRPGVILSTAVILLSSSGLAPAQLPLFSIDYHGPTIGTPDLTYGIPITEGDILGSVPALGPLPPPGIVFAGGVGPTLHHLGLGFYPPAVGHPPGVMGFVEVDAFSLGVDPVISSDIALTPGMLVFSVDEYAAGILGSALLPEVFSESPAGDSSADVFENLSTIPLPNPVRPLFMGTHLGRLDGDGLASGSGYRYPGLGLFEPNVAGGPPDPGDNLDALEMESTDWSGLFFSLDSLYVDPHPLMGGAMNSGSAFAHGFIGGDVLYTGPLGAGPLLYAPAAALGLGLSSPDPDDDDLDALVLWDNGDLIFQPSQFPDHWIGGGADMIFFSVRRGSTVIGMPDSLRGLPIEEGDVLMPPVAPAFGGLSPFPAIYVAAETLGLATVRSGTVTAAYPALGFADDLNALDFLWPTGALLHSATYCFCAAGAPCGNVDPLAGCAHSVGVGTLLGASGSSSVVLDDLVVTATQMPPGQFGLIFAGGGQISFPFGDGLRCVSSAGYPITRLGVANSGAAGTISKGPGIAGTLGLWAGLNINFQCWHRDPAGPCGSGFNLSNGLVVHFTL